MDSTTITMNDVKAKSTTAYLAAIHGLQPMDYMSLRPSIRALPDDETLDKASDMYRAIAVEVENALVREKIRLESLIIRNHRLKTLFSTEFAREKNRRRNKKIQRK